jgi:hypothetical protein
MPSHGKTSHRRTAETSRESRGREAEARARQSRQRRLGLESLEPRLLLSTIIWSASSAPTGGDWDVASNWVGGKVPGPNDMAVISGLRAPGTVFLNSQKSDSVLGLSTDYTTMLKVMTGSLNLGAGSNSTLGGPLNIVQGASLNVGVGANLQIAFGQALTDDGTLSFSRGDSVHLEGLSPAGNILSQITVDGVMNAVNTNFQGDLQSGISAIQINSGGQLVASNCVYALLNLTLSSGSNDTLHGLNFSGQLAIQSGATIDISGNDFSNVGQEGIVASGDARATINLEHNYWGTISVPEIQSKILDHTIDPDRPTVDFQNYVNHPSVTTANPASATSSSSDQGVTLGATVTDVGGLAISAGTVTFTILKGNQVIGQPTAPATVAFGSASTTYTLPAGTPPGQYVIEADYSGAGTDYFLSSDVSHFLTVSMTVGPGPAVKLVIQTQPSATATAGKAFATQPVVYVEDDSGHLETGDNSTVISVDLASGAGPLNGTLMATANGGVARFSDLSDNRAETLTLRFSNPRLSGTTSTEILVSAAPASKLVVTEQPPTTVTAGAGFTLQVSAEDPFDNIDPAFQGAVTLALGTNPGSASLGGPVRVTAVGGIADFSGVTVSKGGNGYTLHATSGNLESATSDPFDVQTPPPPPTRPTVTGERVEFIYLKFDKNHKPVGKPVVAFILQYSAAMNTKTANSVSNYQVDWGALKKVKKKLVIVFHPVTFRATYNAATQSVTLKTSSPATTFAKGGELVINGSGNTGVSSQAGALLDPDYTRFKISPNARAISLE